jgi:hypothetical protein
MRQYRLCFVDGTERQVSADGYRVARKNILFCLDRKVVVSIGKSSVIMIEETTCAATAPNSGRGELVAHHGIS